jgi:hypothetical protein
MTKARALFAWAFRFLASAFHIGKTMIKRIPVVNLTDGRVTSRPSNTPTFDLPEDFDAETAVAALDSRSHAHYRSMRGKDSTRQILSRPLSWRVRGEQCLVADTASPPTAVHRSNYTLCAIEPE